MVSLVRLATPVLVLIYLTDAAVTTVSRKNVFLSRRKRYLIYPMGSNLVVTMSHAQALLRPQPRGWNMVAECDVPFALPSDTRLYRRTKKTKRHVAERRNVFRKLGSALTQLGLNGTACVKRIMCEVLQYKEIKGKSLVKDLIYATFAYPDGILDENEDACSSSFADCSVSLLEYIVGSLSNRN